MTYGFHLSNLHHIYYTLNTCHACTRRSEPVNVCVCRRKFETQRGRQTGMIGHNECFLKEPIGDVVGGGSVDAGVRKCAGCDLMAGCA